MEFSIPQNSDIKIEKVKYSTLVPSYSLFDFFISPESERLDALNYFYTTKHINWEYEQEWRLIYDEVGDKYIDIPWQISGIIFGLKTSLKDKELVKQAASDIEDIKFNECRAITGEFAVEIFEIPR